jgi:four helix bundle protein
MAAPALRICILTGMQDFRRLLVWQRAHAFVLDAHIAIAAIPHRGNAELKAQMRRAVDSIPNNIVEGCAAASRKEFARYLDISIKSASEFDYQLQLARDRGLMSHETWERLAREVVELRKMLWGLRRTVLASPDSKKPGKSPSDPIPSTHSQRARRDPDA